MKIQHAKWTLIDASGKVNPEKGFYPVMEMLLDGRPARIGPEQKYLYYGYDLVFLGANWEAVLPPITVPADRKRGPAQETTLHGYTQDPTIVQLTREFIKATDDGTFRPREIPI